VDGRNLYVGCGLEVFEKVNDAAKSMVHSSLIDQGFRGGSTCGKNLVESMLFGKPDHLGFWNQAERELLEIEFCDGGCHDISRSN
jgi:hypothetical protein